jgi:hypothetical protein
LRYGRASDKQHSVKSCGDKGVRSSSIPYWRLPFIMGARPDFRGDTNFCEAVYHILDPPPLEAEYYREGLDDR